MLLKGELGRGEESGLFGVVPGEAFARQRKALSPAFLLRFTEDDEACVARVYGKDGLNVRVGVGLEVVIAVRGSSRMQSKVFACSVSPGRGPSCIRDMH